MNFGEEQLKLTPGEQLVLDKTNMHLEREHVNTQHPGNRQLTVDK